MRDDRDRLGGVSRTLQRDPDVRPVVHDGRRLLAEAHAPKSGLGDRELELVRVTDNAIRVAGLWDLPKVGAGVPVPHRAHGPLEVVRGGKIPARRRGPESAAYETSALPSAEARA